MEVPHLNSLYKKYQEKGLVIFGINQEENLSDIKEYVEDNIEYPILINADKQFEDYEIQGIPCTYYIDKKGKIIKREIGFAQGSEVAMEQLIVELIK